MHYARRFARIDRDFARKMCSIGGSLTGMHYARRFARIGRDFARKRVLPEAAARGGITGGNGIFPGNDIYPSGAWPRGVYAKIGN